MADTLTNIQTFVRIHARHATLDITTGGLLAEANTIYQGMFSEDFELLGMKIGRRFPEATREDTSITMVVGTEQYTWPSSPVFKRPWVIEGLDTNSSNLPYLIPEVTDMRDWSDLDQTNNARPLRYRLIDVAGTVKLALRPNPDQTDGVRITGLIEVTEFTGGSSSTVFLNANHDRALGFFIAASYRAKKNDLDYAMYLIRRGVGLLPRYDPTPRLRTGGYIQPWSM